MSITATADIRTLRDALPSGTLVLTSHSHTTVAGRVSLRVFGAEGIPLPSKAVAAATGLPHDARRDVVVVRPGDITDGVRPGEVVVERLLTAIAGGEDGYQLGHRPAAALVFGPAGLRAVSRYDV